jgi:hypothetical protein
MIARSPIGPDVNAPADVAPQTLSATTAAAMQITQARMTSSLQAVSSTPAGVPPRRVVAASYRMFVAEVSRAKAARASS